MKFDNIRLLIKDFDKCFDFYKNMLRLESTWGDFGDTYASFTNGHENIITLFDRDSMMKSIGEKVKNEQNYINNFVIVIRVTNVVSTYESLKASGLEFINKPTEMPGWGDKVVHLKDPEGNLIEFCSDLESSKWNKDLLDAKEKYRTK